MGGEKFDTPHPEGYLFGENMDLNFLGNRPVQASSYVLSVLLFFFFPACFGKSQVGFVEESSTDLRGPHCLGSVIPVCSDTNIFSWEAEFTLEVYFHSGQKELSVGEEEQGLRSTEFGTNSACLPEQV